MQLKTSMKLSQNLRMTPQLQQAIKLLQLSRIELENEVRKELIENPVLEEAADTADIDPAKNDTSVNNDEISAMGESSNNNEAQDPRKQDEFEWENYVDNQYKPPQAGAGSGNEEILNYENIITAEQTLIDHLMWQMSLSGFNDEEQTIMTILISYIEDDGYLKTPVDEIAKAEGYPVEEIEEMIPFLHEFDPPGVGARDLKECLLLQAKHLEEDTHELVKIINDHLKDLEKKNYKGIAKEMEIDLEDVVELCKIIYSMDPKPGRSFMGKDTHYITPDVYVYKVGDEYMVSLNEDGLPRLRISNLYRNLLAEGNKKSQNKETQEYIQDKLKSAIWLIKSIHQRQRTIYKVTDSIVKHQREFFEKGKAFIRPMILRDIANDIGMHESTVSRVTSNKYVHTPQGIFELKYFFNSGISKSDGNSLASESVKMKIQKMVTEENPKHPLSDQKIVEILKKEGIQIARRTVAKYRDVLKILPSSKRKKYF